ncbi:MAG: hypothetical protein LBR80_14965, partial [Deltaproteobacteria bacterium]|nr:hypothetical protein [Deltaproteobacteria bacterium]
LAVVFELALETAALVYMLRRLELSGRPGILAALLFFGARSYQTGLLSGMGFSRDASFYTAVFLTVGYLAAASSGIRGRAERTLKFALPGAAFMFGLSSAVMLVTLYLPLLIRCLWRAIASLGPPDGSSAVGKDGAPVGGPWKAKCDLAGEIALWNGCFVAGYLLLTLAVVPRGLGPETLTSGESVGLFYAVSVNLPQLFAQFAARTPLAAVLGTSAFISLGWYAGFSFFAMTVIVLWKTPWAIRRAPGLAGSALRSLAFCLAAAALFTTAHLDETRADIRYLLPLWPYAAILLSLLYLRLRVERPGSARLLFRFLAFAVLMTSANNIASLPREVAQNPSRAASKHAEAVADLLAGNGIVRAYALYWDSHVMEVLSSGKVSSAALDGSLRPYLKNASLDDFGTGAGAGRAAFVRSRNPRPWADSSLELQDTSRALLESAIAVAEIEDAANPVRVYIFDRNPFTFEAVSLRSSEQPPLAENGDGSDATGIRPPEGAMTGSSPQGPTEAESSPNGGTGPGSDARSDTERGAIPEASRRETFRMDVGVSAEEGDSGTGAVVGSGGIGVDGDAPAEDASPGKRLP